MRQTPQQIRFGGFASIVIGLINLLIFGTLALAKHNGSFFLVALAPTLIVGIMGVVYVTQAERIAASPANQKIPKKVRDEATKTGVTPQSLRTAGTVLASTGAGMFVIFLIAALVSHLWSLLFTTVPPAIIVFTMGIFFVATDRPTTR
jgi:uncharacterized membrane protein